ncbi:uncharacterized protein LOC125853220 [Solanum stenotomum]|uniref:uncharacterized protein LOC125853220 n=1 Tax=Solanum stenotomum TaxID=172797 RepID=UPI0020D0F61B|nr:uncharacterized protein LOC125853220 [Solanum stenotomum]
MDEVECETNLRADYDKESDVVICSGKIVDGIVKGKDCMNGHEEGKDDDKEEEPMQALEDDLLKEKEEILKQSPTDELQKVKEKVTSTPKMVQPLPKIIPPFPQRFKNKNEDKKFKKLLSVLKTLIINLPLVEALLEMPGYEKFMKELVTKKRNIDFETIEVSHNCSPIMTSKMITKKEHLREFTIPCTIGMLQFAKVLSDLGASINLMPYAIFKQLGSDFVVLDCEIDAEFPIILGKPFLPTGRALVDVESGDLKFQGYDEVVVALLGLGEYSRNPLKLDINLKNRENPPAKPSTEEPPKLELKVLLAHLLYAFLGENNTLSIIIVADLLE